MYNYCVMLFYFLSLSKKFYAMTIQIKPHWQYVCMVPFNLFFSLLQNQILDFSWILIKAPSIIKMHIYCKAQLGGAVGRGTQACRGMAQSLICVKSENDNNFEVIYQNRQKIGSRIKLDEPKPPFTLCVEYLHHVTCYCYGGTNAVPLIPSTDST